MRRNQTPRATAVPRTVGLVALLVLLASAALLLPPLGASAAEGAPRQTADPAADTRIGPAGPALTVPAVALQPAVTTSPVDAHASAIHPAARPEGPVVDALDAAADAHGIDVALLRAVAWTESSFRPGVRSHAGAVGVMQLMPVTVTHIEQLLGRTIDPQDVTDNVDGGAAYLAYLLGRADGDTRLALSAYFEGWTGVMRDGASSTSASYAQRILDLRAQVATDLLA